MNQKQAIQGWFCPALTPVKGNCDFRKNTDELEKIDRLLVDSSVLEMAIEFALEDLPDGASNKVIRMRTETAERYLRCEVLRHKLGMPSFREFSVELAGNVVYSNFCGLRDIRGVRATSKSALDRASKFFSSGELAQMF